ncbi:MAG: serine/threonine protein kinase [Gemmatimonadaceae bacterium]|jgi:serine/threonine protein kinase|nr:serine/threonine protein kinase [Gemmatimonadaceae bacterium]
MAADPELMTTNRFVLVREVARGGMATVHEAEQVGPAGFTKRMALKIIHDRFGRHPEWRQLFIDEAKLSANLVHGNIVQIYGLGESAGTLFIAMELIKGLSLRTLINTHRARRIAMPPDVAAYCASRVCRALDFAHHFVDENGNRLDIVHRDVSPGNVMLTWDGHVKLGDFGIAKARTMADPSATRQVLLGKKHYMSPEQLMGMAVDSRSDVFSMGVVLFELFALRSLFTEDETMAAFDEVVLNPSPDLSMRLPDADPEIQALVARAIAKDPSGRPNAAILGRELDAWCARQGTPGSPERLQAHLAELFPESYKPPTRPSEAMSPITGPSATPR